MSISLILATLGLATSSIALVHAKLKISSVLVHHATHGKGLKDPKANRLMAEALSALALTTPFSEYKRVHMVHHGKRFAGMEDEEAKYLWRHGFQPGNTSAQSWRLLMTTLASPSFHLRTSAERLRGNLLTGSPLRRAWAWGVWGSIIGSAMYAGMLPGLFLGFVLPLMVGGNIGSFMELVSRHRWLISVEDPRHRHFELSHGRFTAPFPPAKGEGRMARLRWMGRVAGSTIARLTVVPADLNWHHAHHLGANSAISADGPAWCDAALAYSEAIRSDERLVTHCYFTIRAAVDAWFSSLVHETPDR